MKTKWFPVIVICACLLGMTGGAAPGFAQGPDTDIEVAPQGVVGIGFTYQGQLKQGGAPFTGVCDFQFTLWNDLNAGAQVTGSVSKTNVAVNRGVFTAPDIRFDLTTYGGYFQSFSGEARWLQIAVRCPAGSGTYTTLLPRQELSASPYALSLRPGAQVVGAVLDTLRSSVLHVENLNTSTDPFGAHALTAIAHSEWGAGIRGYSDKGPGGVFNSYEGFALVTNGPSLIKNRTPQQIGMLRWYDVNSTPPSVTVGWCNQLAFDGEHMWVTIYGTGKVVKIRASDMAVIGSYDVGPGPNPIIFDGDEIWVASSDMSPGQITRIRASDGSLVSTINPVTSSHWGMAFDGANVWVTNTDTDNVTKIRASDNAILGTYAVGDGPTGIAFDGTYVWVANIHSGTVTKLGASDGSLVGTYPVGADPYGVAFDGANIWVANSGSATVSVRRVSDGSWVHTCHVSAGPIWLAFDGYYMWVTHYLNQGLITRLASTIGWDCGPSPTFQTGSYPLGIAFDGANIWVSDSYSHSVSKH